MSRDSHYVRNLERALSTLRGLRGAPEVPPLCRETQSLGQQMLNALFSILELSTSALHLSELSLFEPLLFYRIIFFIILSNSEHTHMFICTHTYIHTCLYFLICNIKVAKCDFLFEITSMDCKSAEKIYYGIAGFVLLVFSV